MFSDDTDQRFFNRYIRQLRSCTGPSAYAKETQNADFQPTARDIDSFIQLLIGSLKQCQAAVDGGNDSGLAIQVVEAIRLLDVRSQLTKRMDIEQATVAELVVHLALCGDADPQQVMSYHLYAITLTTAIIKGMMRWSDANLGTTYRTNSPMYDVQIDNLDATMRGLVVTLPTFQHGLVERLISFLGNELRTFYLAYEQGNLKTPGLTWCIGMSEVTDPAREFTAQELATPEQIKAVIDAAADMYCMIVGLTLYHDWEMEPELQRRDSTVRINLM